MVPVTSSWMLRVAAAQQQASTTGGAGDNSGTKLVRHSPTSTLHEALCILSNKICAQLGGFWFGMYHLLEVQLLVHMHWRAVSARSSSSTSMNIPCVGVSLRIY